MKFVPSQKIPLGGKIEKIIPANMSWFIVHDIMTRIYMII